MLTDIQRQLIDCHVAFSDTAAAAAFGSVKDLEGEGEGEGEGESTLFSSLVPRFSSPRFYIAAVEKNQSPEFMSQLWRKLKIFSMAVIKSGQGENFAWLQDKIWARKAWV